MFRNKDLIHLFILITVITKTVIAVQLIEGFFIQWSSVGDSDHHISK